MTFNPKRTRESLVRAARALGLAVEVSGSNASASRYAEIGGLKIRCATHDARPTYERLNGAADYELGPHGMAMSEDWKDALAFLCVRLSVTPPKRYAAHVAAWRAAQDRRAAEKAAQRAREEYLATPAGQAELQARCDAAAAAARAKGEKDWLRVAPHLVAIAEFKARCAPGGDLNGKAARERRRHARRQLETLVKLPEERIGQAMRYHQ